jgi:hypothetical protein
MTMAIEVPLKPGETDAYGKTVDRVFSFERGKYVIYETDQHQLVVDGPDFDKFQKDDGINEAVMAIAELTIHSPPLKLKYNSKIAHAWRIILDGNKASGTKELKRIAQDMDATLRRPARLAYQGGALLATVVSLMALAVVPSIATLAEFGNKTLHATSFAAIGGFLSVVINSRQLEIDIKEPWPMNMAYGALRIVIAAVCGMIIVLLIKTDLLMGLLRNAEGNEGSYIAYIVAGFSERFVPNLLAKLERA